METVHNLDVSWMTHGGPKDKTPKPAQRRNTLPSQPPPESTPSSPLSSSVPTPGNHKPQPTAPTNGTSSPQQRPGSPSRPSLTRFGSAEKLNGSSTTPQRRGSWFSSISSKFSSSAPTQSPPQATATPPSPAEISVPKANPARNAVLQHAAKYEGEGPYTPAPAKSQPGLLGVFRRLSSSTGQTGPSIKGNHGLVERRTLNVDRNRERCRLTELNQAKLRRVAFCVDVEIAPMPKYAEGESLPRSSGDKVQARKTADKGEGDALKKAKAGTDTQTDSEEVVNGTPDKPSAKPEAAPSSSPPPATSQTPDANEPHPDKPSGDSAKKKEKKKKSEEERKARKQKKRQLAEANGSIPMEIYRDSDDSSTRSASPAVATPKTQTFPTTNPARIYRRCCQLRETPILKKITEQLLNTANVSSDKGVVEKLDLTGYWMQLPDLITLGDYLAVVPVKEVILENCGIGDEGLRVILSGLLAARLPEKKPRRPVTEAASLRQQGGVVERLVLKDNKIGPEGWKHLCLFIYMCRTLKALDLSKIAFPQQHVLPQKVAANGGNKPTPITMCELLSKSIGERLAGSRLELLNIGDLGLRTEQLGRLIDGIIKCGIKRLGLGCNYVDAEGLKHVARYLQAIKCEGLDLGGNDLRELTDVFAESIPDDSPLVALSLAECNLQPTSLSKLMPKLVKLGNFRFIDLSHNQDLFKSEPSSISLLRRSLPKMRSLKRIHMADVAMTSEQAIALAEVLPEIPELAHIILLGNPDLAKLADARTEESQEEACALFASLLAAARVSTSLVAIDIEVPTEESGEIVRAMARQVVAYCLRNLGRLPLSTAGPGQQSGALNAENRDPEYPDVLQHLVGHDVMSPDTDSDIDTAPDDDYLIGGTGVVKALACCLKNRGDESRRPSGEYSREAEGSRPTTPSAAKTQLRVGKAKDMSKHLLNSARKIRVRLQPALHKAKAAAAQDDQTYVRLLFLDNTLNGIIKRFEDEFPDTREAADSAISVSPPISQFEQQLAGFRDGNDADGAAATSDLEDENEVRRPNVSRSNSIISLSSKGLTEEEGRAHRALYKFRSGWAKYYNVIAGMEEMMGADEKGLEILHEMIDDLNDEKAHQLVREKGVVRVYQEDKEYLLGCLRAQDPELWDRFVESQEKARANVRVLPDMANGTSSVVGEDITHGHGPASDEEAVMD